MFSEKNVCALNVLLARIAPVGPLHVAASREKFSFARAVLNASDDTAEWASTFPVHIGEQLPNSAHCRETIKYFPRTALIRGRSPIKFEVAGGFCRQLCAQSPL